MRGKENNLIRFCFSANHLRNFFLRGYWHPPIFRKKYSYYFYGLVDLHLQCIMPFVFHPIFFWFPIFASIFRVCSFSHLSFPRRAPMAPHRWKKGAAGKPDQDLAFGEGFAYTLSYSRLLLWSVPPGGPTVIVFGIIFRRNFF